MKHHVVGVYKNISSAYASVLTLIGSGHATEDITIVMRKDAPINEDNREIRSREDTQRFILQRTFHVYYFDGSLLNKLSEFDRAMVKPYLKSLENGFILIATRR